MFVSTTAHINADNAIVVKPAMARTSDVYVELGPRVSMILSKDEALDLADRFIALFAIDTDAEEMVPEEDWINR